MEVWPAVNRQKREGTAWVNECAGCWASKVEVGGREQWRLIHWGLLICLDLVEENGASAEARKGFLIVEYRL